MQTYFVFMHGMLVGATIYFVVDIAIKIFLSKKEMIVKILRVTK